MLVTNISTYEIQFIYYGDPINGCKLRLVGSSSNSHILDIDLKHLVRNCWNMWHPFLLPGMSLRMYLSWEYFLGCSLTKSWGGCILLVSPWLQLTKEVMQRPKHYQGDVCFS